MKRLILSATLVCIPMIGCKTVDHGVCAWHRIALTKTTYYHFPVGGTFVHRDFWICATCEEERPWYWNPPPGSEPSPFPPRPAGELD